MSELDETLRAVHGAGAFGAYSAVRDGADRWKGAAGVADVRTGRPTHPGMHHRVGSVTKTFTAAAVLQHLDRALCGTGGTAPAHAPATRP